MLFSICNFLVTRISSLVRLHGDRQRCSESAAHHAVHELSAYQTWPFGLLRSTAASMYGVTRYVSEIASKTESFDAVF